MSEQIVAILKRKLEDIGAYGEMDPETRRNALKEDLQFYILHFIYQHPEYSKWVMYGGSALRIIHGLDRMSVDLDFEIPHAVTARFLEELKKALEDHFENTYGAGSDFLTIKITTGRGLLLKFHVGEALSFGHPSHRVHVKIDLNHFVVPKTVTERRPMNRGRLSFVILTYNKGTLMASKIAAIFLRKQRGVNKNVYDYKGRDIYDLLWYMQDKTTPDFDYLNAKLKEKNKEMKDFRVLFDTLTTNLLNYEKMDDCLKDDLPHLFENPHQFDNWLKTWRESYLRLLDDYKIRTVTELVSIEIHQDFDTDYYSFVYWYKTEEGKNIRMIYTVVYHWIEDRDGDLPIKINEKISLLIGGNVKDRLSDKVKQYATLFYQKTEAYFKKTNRVMLGDTIATKLIRMTADNLNPKEQVVLNKAALLSCELEDLLK